MVINVREMGAKPGDFFPGDVSVLEFAQQVHLTEDAALVEQQLVVGDLLIVVVFVVDISELTATRRQQTPCLTMHNHPTFMSA